MLKYFFLISAFPAEESIILLAGMRNTQHSTLSLMGWQFRMRIIPNMPA